MLIRLATKDDLPRLNELRKQVSLLHAEARPDMFKPGFPQEVADFVYDMYNADSKHILVAQADDRFAAYACLEEIEVSETPYRPARRYLEVDEFGVDVNFRRQGVGRMMFEEIRRFAKDKGYTRIELNMWEFNETALKFYEFLGFSTYRRYMEYTIDEEKESDCPC